VGMELDDDGFESMARDLKIAITRIIDSGLRDPVENSGRIHEVPGGAAPRPPPCSRRQGTY
jgi:hypothetical protein